MVSMLRASYWDTSLKVDDFGRGRSPSAVQGQDRRAPWRHGGGWQRQEGCDIPRQAATGSHRSEMWACLTPKPQYAVRL